MSFRPEESLLGHASNVKGSTADRDAEAQNGGHSRVEVVTVRECLSGLPDDAAVVVRLLEPATGAFHDLTVQAIRASSVGPALILTAEQPASTTKAATTEDAQ